MSITLPLTHTGLATASPAASAAVVVVVSTEGGMMQVILTVEAVMTTQGRLPMVTLFVVTLVLESTFENPEHENLMSKMWKCHMI